MIKRVVLTTLLFAFSSNVMSAQAQFRPSFPNDRNDRFDRGDFRNNFQNYLNDLQRKTDRFKNSIDRDLDRSRSLDGSRREDNLNSRMRDFKNEVDRLRDRFRNRQDTQDNLRGVLRYRRMLDGMMQLRFVSRESRQYWSELRLDLDRLERISRGGDNRFNQNNNGGFYQGDDRYNDNYRW